MKSKTSDLKAQLHESIENVDDEEVLLTVKEILDRKYEPRDPIKLSTEQLQRIDQARASIRKGDFLSNEQADRLVAEWLSE